MEVIKPTIEFVKEHALFLLAFTIGMIVELGYLPL